MRGSPCKVALVMLLVLVSRSAAAQTDGVDVRIRLFDKKIFYLNDTEDLRVKVTIVNESGRPYRFRVADDRIFNLDFEVRTLANTRLAPADEFINTRNSQQYVYFREVEIRDGEEYSFVEPLPRYVSIDRPGVLTVQAYFLPDLVRAGPASERIASNVVPIHVRPPVPTEREQQLLDYDTGVVLQREPIPPDEVVRFTIEARQRGQMERFLLYIDVERLMLGDPERAGRYRRLDEEGRREMVAEYRELLKNAQVDEIRLIPNAYEVLTTQYTQSAGSVTVLQRFEYTDYTELREYTYRVERRDDVWMIVDWLVEIVGTE